MKGLPPKFFLRFFRWYCHARLVDHIEGDLLEDYGVRLKKSGKQNADIRFIIDVLLLFRPGIIKPTRGYKNLNTYGMYKSYFKIGWRNILRNKLYSFVNIGGLATGMTCAILILLYIDHELSYDNFHTQANRIYRLVEDVTVSGNTTPQAIATGSAGPALAHDFPEIARIVRFTRATMLVAYGEKRFQEDHIYFADSTVFDVFTFPLLKGKASSALNAPFSIVLTEETAQRYFGNTDPIGQTLLIDSEHPFTVSGVLKNIPSNSHLQFDILLSMATREAVSPGWLDGWFWSAYTYVQLSPVADAGRLQKKFPEFVSQHTGNGMWDKDTGHALHLQALSDLHLHSRRVSEPGTPGSMTNLYLFSIVAFFIILIASINFVNLTTALAIRRAREIGLRKVIGGTRIQLALQFLSESVLLSLLASLIALGLSGLLLPVFHSLSGILFTLGAITAPSIVSIYLGIALVIGCVAGCYPAILLSGFRIVNILKGSYEGSAQGGALSRGLIMLQFAISTTLISGTIAVFTQLKYMQTNDLGFIQDQVLVLYFGDDTEVQEKMETIKQELLRSPYINSVAASSHIPGRGPGNIQAEVEMESGGIQTADMRLVAVDSDFISFFGIPLMAGHGFSPRLASENTQLMINETAVTQLGFPNPEQAIGKQLVQNGQTGTIIGVIKDFHYESLHNRIDALLLRMRPRSLGYLSMKIHVEDIATALIDLEKRWSKLASHRPFDYFFLDEHFNRQYQADRRFGQVFGVFTGIAILLACLGLFGITSYTVRQRAKEIGIRKVLGASVAGIVALLSKDFIRLVLIAAVISTPFAWYMISRWLQDFAYRIELQWWMFLLPSACALMFAMLTLSFQSVKAATADPVDSLRTE